MIHDFEGENSSLQVNVVTMMTTKVFNLSGVPTRRRRLGRKTCVLSGLVGLAKSGPKWSRRDALAAMLNLVVVNSLESVPICHKQ